jgi:hypothetical protein
MSIISKSLIRTRRVALRALGAAVTIFGLSCHDALKIEDPQTFSNEDLNDPAILAAVANGVEGAFQQVFDDVLVYTELMSDEIEDTSTWLAWSDMSNGRVRGDWPTAGDFSGAQNGLLRARYAAQNAAERFARVLGSDAANKSKIMAQVKTVEAWSDLINGMAFCEAPKVAGGPRFPDAEIYKQAVQKFGDALTVAVAAGDSAWIDFARAGSARANLLAGNYDAALADAQLVRNGFLKQALYSTTSQTSFPGNQFHQNRNRSGGLRRTFWSMVDTSNNNLSPTPTQYVKDPWTLQSDPRMAVVHPRGRLGVNNSTLHYSIDKYKDYASPITITSKREMNLIEAEVYWRKGDFTNAIAALNRNRTTAPANLPAFTAAGLTSQDVFNRLLSERMAELFVEGHRMTDLDRFNLVTQRLGTGRARKLPMSRDEILNNASMKVGDAKCPSVS